MKGTAVATPYKNLESVVASMSGLISKLTAAPIAGDATTTDSSGSTATGSIANSESTGAAALNGPNSFGKSAGIVMGIWGAAAFGGAGWFLMA